MKYSEIDRIRQQKKFSKIELVNHIGISRDGYDKMLKNETMKVEVLEKIAQVLQVPVCTFFKEKETTPNYKLNDENSVVNETFNQNNQHSMENIIRDLIKENGELKVENAKLRSQLAGNGNGINQTGT